MKKVLCITNLLVFLFFFTDVNAQKKKTLPEIPLQKAKQQLFYGNYTDAISTTTEALETYKKANNIPQIAASYNVLAKIYYANSELQKSFEYAQKALELSRNSSHPNKKEEANALDNIGGIYVKMGKGEESLNAHTKAFEIRTALFKNDSLHLARSYFNLGLANHELRKLPKALDYFQKGLDMKFENTPERRIVHADIYEAIGHIHYDKQQLNEALSYFEKTLQIALEVYHKEHPYFGKVYNDFGIIYSDKNEFNQSIEYYKKALSISIANHGLDNHADQVRAHYNIGSVYQMLNDRKKALFHTQKTLELGMRFYGANHPRMYFPYSQLGQIYGDERGIPYIQKAIDLCLNAPKVNYVIASFQYEYLSQIYFNIKNYPEAIKYIQKSLEIRLRQYGERNVSTIRNYNNLAKTYAQLKEFQKALMYNEKAINANNLSTKKKNNITDHFTSATYINNDMLLESVKTKADILFMRYQDKKQKNDLTESFNYYEQASSLIQLVRKSKRNYNDKIKFSEIVKSVYVRIIETTFLLDDLGDKTGTQEGAFYASEKSKAHTLRVLLKTTEVKKKFNLPTEIVSLEKEIDSKISVLKSKIIQTQDSIQLYQLEGKVFDLTKRKDSLKKSIETQYPEYYKLNYQNDVVRLSDLQEKLDDNTTFFSFFKYKKALYAFVITNDTLNIKRLAIDNLDTTIHAFNTAINEQNHSAYQKNAAHLYTQLITPLKQYFKGKQLIIAPDEALWHLQFDLLLTNSNITKDNALPYMLYDYAISYTNSASVLFETYKKASTTSKMEDCIAFSYANKDGIQHMETSGSLKQMRNSNIDLPGTRQEIKAISNILNGKYLYGKKANETNFKNNVDKFKIIHLALHGDIDNTNPNNLKIYFSEGSTNDDDKLFGHELFTLNIPADLVVLSACNTGTGTINKAEGIQSLGNAFQHAGAKSLLLSRWEISDVTTPKIMESFYKNIRKGLNKSEALQQAKIEFLKTADHFSSAPFYWGSFYVLGDTTAITFSNSHTTIWVVSIIAILLISILVYYLKNKKRSSETV